MNPTDETLPAPAIDADLLESFRSLPGEDDLPYEDGIPMETLRHREQMNLLIDTLQLHWADRQNYFVGGNMFLHYNAPSGWRRSCEHWGSNRMTSLESRSGWRAEGRQSEW